MRENHNLLCQIFTKRSKWHCPQSWFKILALAHWQLFHRPGQTIIGELSCFKAFRQKSTSVGNSLLLMFCPALMSENKWDQWIWIWVWIAAIKVSCKCSAHVCFLDSWLRPPRCPPHGFYRVILWCTETFWFEMYVLLESICSAHTPSPYLIQWAHNWSFCLSFVLHVIFCVVPSSRCSGINHWLIWHSRLYFYSSLKLFRPYVDKP